MKLDIDGSSIVRRPEVRQHVEREIARHLGPFARRIGTVRIRVRDRAPSERTRAFCGIAVTLDLGEGQAGSWVLGRAEEDDKVRAIERAIERVAAAVGKQIARRDRERALYAQALETCPEARVLETA